MNCQEAQELITALVDKELYESERLSIESHLKGCERCRFVYEQEQALKREVRAAAASVTAPADLREKILSGLRDLPEREQSPKSLERPVWLSKLAFRPAFVFALLLLLVIPAIYLMRPKEPSIPLFALESHRNIVGGTFTYVKEKSPERLKEKLLRSVDGRFTPMGYDLSMIGLQPAGGTVEEVGGRKIMVAIYEGKASSLSCYTFLGTKRDIPDDAALFFDAEKKIHFYTFSRDGVNGVIHREGKVICILVSELPIGELLALARSKAQPSPPF